MSDTPKAVVNGHEAPPGCYIDGHWGQYGPDRLADIAEGFGWHATDPSNDPRYWRSVAVWLYDNGYGVSDAEPAAWERLHEAADRIEAWLNEHTEGDFVWSWEDGEFFLMPYNDDGLIWG